MLADLTWQDRAGFCAAYQPDQPAGVLDAGQRAGLRALAQRCKVVHDLMAYCADRYAVFPADALVEQTRALVAVRGLLARYDVVDPHAGLAPGQFASPTLRHDFERLTRQASGGRTTALAVLTRLLRETADLVDIELACPGAADVRHVCRHLSVTIHRRLRLMQAWSPR